MKPIVLIHGYSAESEESTKPAIVTIYGDLPVALRNRYGANGVVEIDLSRYISIDDGLTIDDISRALDRTLHDDHAHLLERGFHAIVHSTGALVIRNWLRTFSPKPSPLSNLVYMAGANFGSGWAHIGQGQFAKWGRLVFQGTERGMRILHALELGSDWTIELHRHFVASRNDLVKKYEVFEHVVVGTQASVGWFAAPVRYAKEDGADGVVRVAASNVNFNYVKLEATRATKAMSWSEIRAHTKSHMRRSGKRGELYRATSASRPGVGKRAVVPFAIPCDCAHSGDDLGIVRGRKPREQVLRLLDLALTTTRATWPGRVAKFDAETDATYERACAAAPPGWWKKWIENPRAQYDKHAQVILRLRDQDGRPVLHYDVFFDSVQGRRDKSLAMRELIEHKHVNGQTPNVITFYLRTDTFDADANAWVPQVPKVDGCYLEISASEPATDEILYAPLRFEFSSSTLAKYIVPHMTTIIDVELLRVPSPDVYRMVRHR